MMFWLMKLTQRMRCSMNWLKAWRKKLLERRYKRMRHKDVVFITPAKDQRNWSSSYMEAIRNDRR